MEKNYSIMVQQLKRKKAVSILALAFMASISVNAQTWTGTTGNDFVTATNWDTGAAPIAGGNVTINTATNNPIVATTTSSVCSTLTLTVGATLEIQGTLFSSAACYTGGTITINGGTLNVDNNLYFGITNNIGTCTINSGTLKTKSALIVGEKGEGILNINGGNVTTGSTIIIGGYYAASTVNLNEGTLVPKASLVGTAAIAIKEAGKNSPLASGILRINGGTLVLGGDQKAFIDGYVEGGKIVAGAGKKIVVTVVPAIPAIIADPTATPPVIAVAAVAAYTNVTAQAILGMDSKTLNNSFSVYPNPSKGVININAKNTAGNLNVSIYNLLGQQVLSSSLEGNNSGNYSLDASTKLTSGTYIVNIKSDSSNYSSKIVVE